MTMVDEKNTNGTTGPAAASNTSPQQAPQSDLAREVGLPPQTPPTPRATPISTPTTTTDATTPPAPEPIVTPNPPVPPPPKEPEAPEPIVTPLTTTPPPVPPKNPPEAAVTPKEPPVPTPPPIATQTKPLQGAQVLENNIAQVIADTKLPERREFRATGDAPLPVISKPPTSQEAASPKPSEAVTITPSKSPDKRSPLSSVHTLKDDLQEVVRDEKISLVRAAALEEDKRAHRSHEAVPEDTRAPQRRRFAGTIITIIVLIVVGCVALAAVVFVQNARQGGGEGTLFSNGLVFSEQNIPFSLTGETALRLKQSLASARSSTALTLGAITRLTPTVKETVGDVTQEREATLSEFLTAIDAHAPADLIRALDDEFFFGIHTVDENAPLLVIPVNSYERAFAGMLTWEKNINGDLSPIFTGVPRLLQNPDGLVVERAFEDAIMRNYDVRTLKDDAGNIQLYYSFPTREFLIIAESPYSFTEILSRLRAERKL